MITDCPIKVNLIDENSVIGDTLQTFNDNFAALQNIICGVEGAVSILKNPTNTGAISKIKGGNGIVVDPESGIVRVSQSYSPPWHVGKTSNPLYNENLENRVSQQVTKSSLFLNYLYQLTTLTPVITGSESYTFVTTNNGYTAPQYSGLVTLGDGRILLYPNLLDNGSIYDPNTGVFSKLTAPIPAQFANAILLPDGRVCLIPGVPKNIVIWNPQTNDVFTSSVDLSIPGVSTPAYYGGTLLPDGRILLTPFNRQDGTVIYDPVTDTVTHIYSSAFTSVGGMSFFSGILSLDGNYVYLTPYNSTQMVKVSINEPYTVTFTGAGSLDTGTTEAYSSSVLLPDGRVFLVPFKAKSAMIYDPTLDTFTVAGKELFSGVGNFVTGILIPDGRVLMVPYNIGYFWYYNYKDGSFTVSDKVSINQFSNYLGATVLEDGNIFVAPCSENRAVLINPGHQQGYMRSTVTGMYFKETL